MRAMRLFIQLTVYYAIIAGVVLIALRLYPNMQDYLPIGGVEQLLTQPDANPLQGSQSIRAEGVGSLGDSLFWLAVAIFGGLLTSLPVSWVYMGIRSGDEYDQSLINTILILPLVVTGIVIIVQNSLALAFSLGGIAGAVRFKNTLKSSGDALFILLAIGIGLSSGIGAVELALVMSAAFNYCFLALWLSEYGERSGMKRYMSDYELDEGAAPVPPVAPAAPPTPPA